MPDTAPLKGIKGHFFSLRLIPNLYRSQTLESDQCRALATSIQAAIQSRIRAPKTPHVWSADDFADVGSRRAIDLSFHRLVSTGDVRRITRGL